MVMTELGWRGYWKITYQPQLQFSFGLDMPLGINMKD